VNVGALQIGVSLDTLFNQIRIVYVANTPGSTLTGVRGMTGFSTHTESIAEYGTRELSFSQSGDTAVSALAARDTLTAQLSLPRPVVTPNYGQSTVQATLVLRGWWETLGWTYFARTAGIEQHAVGSTAQRVGLGFTSTKMGFEAATKYISDVNAQLGAFTLGMGLRIAGSASNDGTYTVDQGTLQVQETYTAATVSFDLIQKDYTAATISFDDDSGTYKIKDSANGLAIFAHDDVITITGSASNNGVFTVDSVAGDGSQLTVVEAVTDEAAGATVRIVDSVITYKIKDSANGLGIFAAHDVIQIAGSASNDGYYRIISVTGVGSEIVVTQAVTDEAAGASVTVTNGHHVRVSAALVDEMPGASVTVTAVGMKVAQSLQLGSTEGWNAYSIKLLAAKVGAPSDNLTVTLCADNAGVPGTVLATVSVAGSVLTTSSAWVTFALSSYVALALSTTYWLVAQRSGSNDPANYYTVGVDEALGYPRGALLLWDGSAWVMRSPDADMAFEIAGVEETTVQIARIETDEAQFCIGTTVDNLSGVYTSPYRDGDSTARTEIEALLLRGTTNARRLLAEITRDRYVRVYEEPAPTDANIKLFLDSDGKLTVPLTGPLTSDELPVGRWCGLIDLPASFDQGLLASPSPFFIESAEFDVTAQQWRVTPRNAQDVWSIGEIEDG